MQKLVSNRIEDLEQILSAMECKKIFLVCDSSYPYLSIREDLERLPIPSVSFSDFTPNPLYEDVCKGVDLFNGQHCDAIVAVGGGSAMDVAKCIKLYSNMDPAHNYLRQQVIPNDIPLIAIPTTAGTGSEATRYAVIYYNGEKQSITHDSIIPGYVILEPSVLKTLPPYQRKATMLDALCHAIESWWSVNSTPESRTYSQQAVKEILKNKDAYLANEDRGNAEMLHAAHVAGQAINITQTTAGHAMCYKLTSLYGLAHGHAAALCVEQLWPYMLAHLEDCIDPRGREHLERVFDELAAAFGCDCPEAAAERFRLFLEDLSLGVPAAKESDYTVLAASVNPVRLKNHPIELNTVQIEKIYRRILSEKTAESR